MPASPFPFSSSLFFVSSSIHSLIHSFSLLFHTVSSPHPISSSAQQPSNTMLLTDLILSKKGPLAKVWISAHHERKLSKAQALQIDVNESIEAILEDQVEPLALRMSGQLMLGVVRIYSRKAQYLMDDCKDVRDKITMAFRPGQVDLPADQLMASRNAITNQESRNDFDLFLGDFQWYVLVSLTLEESFTSPTHLEIPPIPPTNAPLSSPLFSSLLLSSLPPFLPPQTHHQPPQGLRPTFPPSLSQHPRRRRPPSPLHPRSSQQQPRYFRINQPPSTCSSTIALCCFDTFWICFCFWGWRWAWWVCEW